MKNRFLTGIFFALFAGGLAFGTPALAQETGMEQGSMDVTVDVSVSQDEQARLQQIAQELESIETEVNRLSLLVNKVVLEKQAVALQEQVQERIAAMNQPTGTAQETAVPAADLEVSEESQVAMEESQQPVSETPATGQEQPSEIAANQEEGDIFRNLSIDSEGEGGTSAPLVSAQEEDDENSGFLAALGSIRNLGTPEIVTLFILAVLAIFVIVRRVTTRSKGQAPKKASTEPAQQQALNEQRQDLQERVAWK